MAVYKRPGSEELVEAHAEVAEALANDANATESLGRIEMDRVNEALGAFEAAMPSLARYIEVERRLQAVRISGGEIGSDQREELNVLADHAMDALDRGFGPVLHTMGSIAEQAADSRLGRYLDDVIVSLEDPRSPFARLVMAAFADVGFSRASIEQMREEIGRDGLRIVERSGSLRALVEKGHEGVEAHRYMIEYTRENGLDYIEGSACCVPAGSAVLISKFLVAIGIGVSAWWIMAAMAAVITLVIVICNTRATREPIVRNACNWLSEKPLNFFRGKW